MMICGIGMGVRNGWDRHGVSSGESSERWVITTNHNFDCGPFQLDLLITGGNKPVKIGSRIELAKAVFCVTKINSLRRVVSE